jgi:DNA modification methylase
MTEDWSFAHLKRVETLWGPHGYHRYPAKFIPQLVQRILEGYSSPGDMVGDPFLGSATTGIEALRLGRRFVGSDVSQVALLISRAKCRPLCPGELEAAWERLDRQLESVERTGRRQLSDEEKAAIHAIDIERAGSEERFLYWFPAAHRRSLDAIFQRILSQPEPFRAFFLCGFSNVLKRCSTWLSGSTKAQKDLGKTLGDPADEFRKQARDMLRRNALYWNDCSGRGLDLAALACEIRQEDARHLSLPDGCFDLLLTSPPYATCYEYKEIHQLTQLWFEHNGMLAPIDACSWIGSKGVSHRASSGGESGESTGSTIANEALLALWRRAEGSVAQAVHREAQALRYYFQDMRAALSELVRVTAPGRYLVLVIGNSYRRGVLIPTSEALCEMAHASGLVLERKIVRKIPVRVLVSTRDKKTGRFSSSAQSDTQVYPEEHVLVFRRC